MAIGPKRRTGEGFGFTPHPTRHFWVELWWWLRTVLMPAAVDRLEGSGDTERRGSISILEHVRQPLLEFFLAIYATPSQIFLVTFATPSVQMRQCRRRRKSPGACLTSN
jgi:hypothetical protein